MRAALRAVLFGRPAYTAQALALFARMSTEPDTTRKGVINTLISSLISAGVWDKLDALYLLAAHDAQAARLNWKSTSFNCTAVNSPTFTTDRGYAGDGSTSYLDTGYAPSTAGGVLTLNSAHLSFWDRTSRAAAVSIEMGSGTVALRTLQLASRFSGNVAIGGINDAAFLTPANSNSSGFFVGNRSGASARQLYRNASSLGNDTQASSSLTPLPVWILGRNNDGALNAASTDQIAAASIGASLTAQEVTDFYSAMQTYMTAVGA